MKKSFYTSLGVAAMVAICSCVNVTAAGKNQAAQPFESNMDSFDTVNMEKSNWTNGSMFNCGWLPENVTFDDGVMTLHLNNTPSHGKDYSGAEYRTKKRFPYGTFEVRMKAAKGDGMVSSFFTYTGPSNNDPWDEIDFEVLGKDTTKVQLNYYVNGQGGHEKLIDLGFDASEDFHVYTFKWTKGKIEWYVDGKLVHTAKGSGLPTHPQQIMVNLWPGIGVDSWLKPFKYTGEKTASYDYIKYTPEETK